MSDRVIPASGNTTSVFIPRTARQPTAWTSSYLRIAATLDACCALAAVLLALQVRFDNRPTPLYAALSIALPALWLVALALAGGYDTRFVGVGSEEFRKVVTAGVSLTAVIAFLSYAANLQLSRGYIVIALPSVTVFDVVARYGMRKRLHKLRSRGACMRRVIAVGHEPAVADLIAELRRENYHGLSAVGACLALPPRSAEIEGVPVYGGLDDVLEAVITYEADTVAVLACPEINGIRLRQLAWQLEKTDTDLCVAPSLVDVAGPRMTIRAAAGLTLVHVDHPELTGIRLIMKGLFDRVIAGMAILFLAPVFLGIAFAIRHSDKGPALFRQIRVGKDGNVFKLYKFRTMTVDADQQKKELLPSNDFDGVLFKLRKDPRITPLGARLRRWSVDELPQLINVFLGNMSLVGPRPALPDEAARYADHVRRRLVLKPGITGLWQVSGRSDLTWEESVRLDLRYVENWSFILDVQILWKTTRAVFHGSGAY